MTIALQPNLSAMQDWWASLKHGGLLIAPSKLSEFFVAESLSPLPRFIEDRLRRDVTRLQNGEDDHLSTFLDTVLEEVLGLTGDWQKGSQVDRTWSYPAITREIIRPRRVWLGAHGEVLPVFVADGQEVGGKVTRLGIGRGKRAVSRVVEWLRKANQKIALLTNGYQWRLIHAGADYDAWCEWDVTFWFEEGQPSSQVTALRLLLGQQALQTNRTDVPSPLLAAIASSRQGQAELSEVLGERVRQAVELLIRESSESLTQVISPHPLTPSPTGGEGEPETGSAPLARSGRGAGGEGVSSRHVYIAATRIVMRCVVILFAEARDLLPRDNPIYHSAYGLQGLREQLDRRAGGRAAERLRQGVSSWSRLLALFKLVYEGCAHEALPVPQYGGGLFEPGNPEANDPILRALSAFENPSHTPSDAIVYRILELLCRSKVKVRQGRRSTWVEAPVDFSDLSSEYIGILYEGLLDFELRQAAAEEPMVFLNLGDQPVLPLTRLEGMDDKTLSALVEKLKQKAKAVVEDQDSEEDEDAESDEAEPEEVDETTDDVETDSEPVDEVEEEADQLQTLRDRAQQWAVRAVKAGKLVPKPRSKKADAQAAYEQAVGKAASSLIARVVLPGEWFLVRWGGTRKGSGTFYTRPQLAIPTVQRTLLPLAYNSPHPPAPSPTRGEEELEGSPFMEEVGVRGKEEIERWEVPEQLRQKMLEVARQFRKEPTSSEAVLWEALRGRRLEGRKFRRQQPIGSFVVDFFCPDERLIIEVDGGVHESQRELDQQRQDLLESLGLRFTRIQSEQVETDLDTALNTICTAFSPLSLDGRGAGGEGGNSFDGRGAGGEGGNSLDGRRTEGEGDKANWTPKTPIEILNLKICDPACGSASFLLAALRFLLEALWQSLFYHGWLVERGEEIVVSIPLDAQPDWFAECVQELPVTVEKAEERSKPRLKRFIVERCLYGVDINPLAVELARLALWVETMDKYLPFGFLDHKIKCGNALVGCWFDQFQDYPVMAWEREAGDKTHKGVHFAKEVWTKEIKRLRKEVVQSEMKELLTGVQLSFFEDRLIQPPEQTHDELQAAIAHIHSAVFNPSQQAQEYEQSIRQKQALRQLKWAFDCWCAVWFWQGDRLDAVPTPMRFVDPPPETQAAVEQLATIYQFFHWELEFPDVFTGEGAGFDGVVGNPPWETLQPNSKEFFSNIDPLYRTYGKQDALNYQQQYFENDHTVEENWLAYCAQFKAIANWCKYVSYPFGDNEAVGSKFVLSRKKVESDQLHNQWRTKRQAHQSYADRRHPFRYQGEGKPYTYKMFTELAHALIKTDGRFSLIIPSGIYTDKGSAQLRNLFLNQCEWTHLYSFQNERFVFGNIHHSFKMVILTINKIGQTETIATRFRLGPGDSPEAQELETDILNDFNYLSVPAQQIKRFSPNTGALLEVRTEQDLRILEKMYENGVLLGDRSAQGWGIQYRQGDFNMTSDSKLFSPRPKWEEKGYRPDEYGHWLKGNWRDVREFGLEDGSWASGVGSSASELGTSGLELETLTSELKTSSLELGTLTSELEISSLELETSSLEGEWSSSQGELSSSEGERSTFSLQSSILHRPEGLILSADGQWAIELDEVEDVAMPLYQGIMVHQFNSSVKGWKSGTGAQALWEELPLALKTLEPQYLVSRTNYQDSPKTTRNWKVGYRRIARTTDTRTWIGSLVSDLPAGDSIFYLLSNPNKPVNSLTLIAVLNSFAYDWQLRNRLGGTNLSWFVLEETACIRKDKASENRIHDICLRLIGTTLRHATEWIIQANLSNGWTKKSWYSLWAATPYERLRLRCILDALVAELYSLDFDSFKWILSDCDYPVQAYQDSEYLSKFEPKGFWRADKEKDPELRHTVLSLIAFHHLKQIGLEAFLNLNDGEGWMLPDTLRLADYGLGHDDRAKEHQPVAARLGDRFLPWQLESTPEESWAECERHAENLKKLLGNAADENEPEQAEEFGAIAQLSDFSPPRQLNLLDNDNDQLNLFNQPDEPTN